MKGIEQNYWEQTTFVLNFSALPQQTERSNTFKTLPKYIFWIQWLNWRTSLQPHANRKHTLNAGSTVVIL